MTDAPARPKESPGPWKLLWRKFRKNRVAVTGGIILIVLYVCSCLAGFLSPYLFDEGDDRGVMAPPALLGSYDLVPKEVVSRDEPGKRITTYDRQWRWFSGGVHFHDSDGEFTLRPHVHPVIEKKYEDEHGEVNYVHGCVDESVSLPIEFFVEGSKEHELASLLGLFPIRGRTHLFGVRAPEGLKGAARVHLLGSDGQGRDTLSRLLYGSQISLSIGILCVVVTMTVGMVVGGLSGYFSGMFDVVAMRVVEVVLSVPDLYLMIVLGGILRDVRWDGKPLTSRQTYMVLVFIMSFVGWAARARVVRGMVLSLRENDYVVAARALGVSSWRIITKHILPNTLSFAIVSATLAIPGYILGEVALSFLGLGIQDPEASWGNMLREAQTPSYLVENPWSILPGVFIFITVLAYNFLGDGLRDAADPRAVIVRSMKKDLDAAKKEDDAKARPVSSPAA
jgi:peptide/nickel transport system permease protein